MTDESSNRALKLQITDEKFDSPLYVHGFVSGEPEMYLGEKPYELSKHEFSVLKKGKYRSDFWFQITCGATGGLVLAILGKTLHALIGKRTPSLETWEIWAILAGVVIAFVLKLKKKNDDEKEFDEMRQCIDQHFLVTPKRRIHVLSKEEDIE